MNLWLHHKFYREFWFSFWSCVFGKWMFVIDVSVVVELFNSITFVDSVTDINEDKFPD